MTKLAKVRKAIEIQGHIDVRVDGQLMPCRSIKVIDGDWVTDIPTPDLMGHIRIRRTKDDVVRRAEQIIAREPEIRAEREARVGAAMDWQGRRS